jgi:hypothetical protein
LQSWMAAARAAMMCWPFAEAAALGVVPAVDKKTAAIAVRPTSMLSFAISFVCNVSIGQISCNENVVSLALTQRRPAHARFNS